MTIVTLGRADIQEAAPRDLGAGCGERSESGLFFQWEHRRWLNSDMRLRGTPECRALYFDLICISFDHSPIGTLPDDIDELARLLMVDAEHFKMLCRMEFGPLHKWRTFDCDGEVRLCHDVVTATIQEAVGRKEDSRARSCAPYSQGGV